MRVTSEWSDSEVGRKVQVSWVAFTSDGRQDDEMDTRTGKVSAVTRALPIFGCHETRIVEKGKALNFQNSFCPILTYGHESWVMTERMRSQVQASEMRFLRRIEGVTLFNKVRSSEIRKSLNIKPLLFRIERFQLRLVGHVSKMPQKRLSKQTYLPQKMGKDDLDNLELDKPITLVVLDGIAWYFTLAK